MRVTSLWASRREIGKYSATCEVLAGTFEAAGLWTSHSEESKIGEQAAAADPLVSWWRVPVALGGLLSLGVQMVIDASGSPSMPWFRKFSSAPRVD
jgi:hypothetical protein